jgi:Holliday junction resolvase RusA-like endonuclease
MTTISLDVLGTPAPKGSTRAILISGRAVNVPGGSNANKNAIKAWHRAVSDQGRLTVGDGREPVFVDQPMTVYIQFRMARPKGHFGSNGAIRVRAPAFPATKPDIDKLARSTLDALTGIVWDDDSRIVRLILDEDYAVPGQEGATILVKERKVGASYYDLAWFHASPDDGVAA